MSDTNGTVAERPPFESLATARQVANRLAGGAEDKNIIHKPRANQEKKATTIIHYHTTIP